MIRSAGHHNSTNDLLNTLSIGIIQFDTGGKVIFCNAAAEKLTGYPYKKIKGKPLTEAGIELFKNDYSPCPAEAFPVNYTLKTGKPVLNEIIGIKTPEGKTRWLSICTDPVPGNTTKGEASLVIASMTDITEWKKTDDTFKGLLELAPDAMVIINSEGRIHLLNQQTEKLFGYKREELLGQPLDLLIPERYLKNHHRYQAGFLAEPHTRGMGEGKELFGKKKNGDEIPVEISLSPLETDDLFLISAAIRDISERKKTEEKLLRFERKFHIALNSLGDNTWEHDFETGKTWFSETIEELLGYPQGEIADNASLWWSRVHPNDRILLEENDSKYKKGLINRHTLEYRVFHKDGSLKWILDRGRVYESDAYHRPLKVIGTHKDITSRKISEERLIESERNLRDLIQNVPGVIYQWYENNDGSFGFNYVSPKIRDYFNLEPHEMGKIVEYIHPGDIDDWRKSIDTSNQTGTPWFFEGRLLYPDGTVKWWQGFSVISRQTNTGKIYNGIMIDVTDKKKLERLAKEQEEQIKLFIKNTPVAIAMLDENMRYLIASDTWYKDYHLTGEKIIGRSHYDVFPEILQNEEWLSIHQRCLRGNVEKKERDLFIRKDGSVEWIRWEIYPWKKDNLKTGGILIFTEIITDRIIAEENLKRLNTQLIISNKDLEQFAYVASHDLQEPLRMVSNFLQLLEKKYGTGLDETASQYIQFAVKGAERMKTLIADLLRFSRVGSLDKESHVPVDLNQVLKEITGIYTQQVSEHRVSFNIQPLPEVRGSRLQLEQLFQNLISNAVKYNNSSRTLISIGFKERDSHWEFFVKDNGIGIEEKYYDRIFTIFQRLHDRNEYSGTGIGLSICKKIVEKHEGEIWVRSTKGKGSTFYFTIPK